MSYRIFDYHKDEYQLLENELNQFSMQGYNPKQMDMICHLKKDNCHYHYYCDIDIFKKGESRKQEMDALIDSYMNQNLDYCGKIKKIYVFRQKSDKPVKRYHTSQDIQDYFETNKSSRMIPFLISLAFTFFVFSFIFPHLQIYHLITNGSLALYYSFIPIVITMIFYTFNNWIHHERLRQRYLKKSFFSDLEIKKIITLKKWSHYLILFCFLYVAIGLGSDYFQRQQVPVDSTVMTLASLQKESQQTTYNQSQSLLVRYKSFTDYNDDNDILHQEIYQLNNQKQNEKYFTKYFDELVDNHQYQQINDNVYIIQTSSLYDAMIIYQETSFIYISTSFDLTDSTLQNQILDFYQK